MRPIVIVPLVLSVGCAPVMYGERATANLNRLRAPPIRGLVVHARSSGGVGRAVRLDDDLLGFGSGSGRRGTCGSSGRTKAGKRLIAAKRRGCARGAMGAGVGAGGLGTRGTGRGGGGAGGGMGVGVHGLDPAAGLLQTTEETRRAMQISPWGWAFVDLPYRDGPAAHFQARPEAAVSEARETQERQLSTFAVDVDTAAYSIARRALVTGARPEPTLVRPEEMLNAFRYNYPEPAGLIGITTDGARSPYGQDRFLLRVGLQARTVAASAKGPVNLVFLIDTSCSMSGSDRLALAKQSVELAVSALAPDDQVAIATYAGATRVVLPPTPAADLEAVQVALTRLDASGGTSMGTGLELAYQLAESMHQTGDHSHVVVCSDGDANIGPSNAEQLLASISAHARRGVALSTVGFGAGNYRDEIMERLANEGDGSYAYVDSPRQARRVFTIELLRTVQDVARDVKIQVALDAQAVLSWRLVGYENRVLKSEDFEDDLVDAGDVGSGHQVTALYELRLRPGTRGELGEIRVRARPVAGGPVQTLRHQVSVATVAHPFEHARQDLRLATAILGFAELLRRSPYAQDWRLKDVLRIASDAGTELDPDRAELVALIMQFGGLEG